ncbi:MAG TPA: CHASE3 domain-containing protein [Caldimonas sp.]|jgi:signal transduction histidine kinase|nr:CHASE3 domain-containing protein [Caldimonas sp.]HEX2542577.1 CHASE3 domain-containing protein [Caldimonas sp.]
MSFLSRIRRNVFAFPLAAAAALAMLAISEASYQDATSSLDALGARGEARTHLNALVKGLLDAETGERGYLLTQRTEYLTPYRRGVDDVRRALEWLVPYYARDTRNAELMRQIVQGTEAKLSEMETTIELHDRGVEGSWRELVLSDIGKEKMERVRSLGEELLKQEGVAVAVGRQSVYQTLMLNRIGVSAMAAVSLLALFMYLRQTATLDRTLEDEARRVAGERDRLEREVTARTAQLKELAQHLQTIREDERNHLARELHDELGALLTAAKLDVARLKSRLGSATAPENVERLAHLNETLNGGIALKRRIIEDLRPSSLSNLGLVAALEILLREFSTRTEIEVVDRLEPVELDPSAELTVYRLVQEALTNIVKYAKATDVTVTLAREPDGVARISVHDNGVGFDVSKPSAATHGLIGMRYRVEAEGGAMHLESVLGEGTLIEATLPRRSPPAPPPSGAASELPASATA